VVTNGVSLTVFKRMCWRYFSLVGSEVSRITDTLLAASRDFIMEARLFEVTTDSCQIK